MRVLVFICLDSVKNNAALILFGIIKYISVVEMNKFILKRYSFLFVGFLGIVVCRNKNRIIRKSCKY